MLLHFYQKISAKDLPKVVQNRKGISFKWEAGPQVSVGRPSTSIPQSMEYRLAFFNQ